MLNHHIPKVIKTHLAFSCVSALVTKKPDKIELLEIPTEKAVFNKTKDEEEILIVISGNGGVIINAESSLIKIGDVICIPKNSIRSLANIEREPLQVISIVNSFS